MPNRFGALRPTEIVFDSETQTLKSQGREGSCVIQAITNALEYGFYHWKGWRLDINAEIVYQWAKEFNGYRYNFQSGEECIKEFQRLFRGIPARCRDTGEIRMVRMQEIKETVKDDDTEDEVRMMNRYLQRGIGLVCAYPTYPSSFKNCISGGSGILHFPENESPRGGHANCISGTNKKKRIKIIGNSWGETWGANKNGTLLLRDEDTNKLFDDISAVYINKKDDLSGVSSTWRQERFRKKSARYPESKFTQEVGRFFNAS